jgi:hypothetical protein
MAQLSFTYRGLVMKLPVGIRLKLMTEEPVPNKKLVSIICNAGGRRQEPGLITFLFDTVLPTIQLSKLSCLFYHARALPCLGRHHHLCSKHSH